LTTYSKYVYINHYHEKVNKGYLEIAKRDNCVVIPYIEGDLKTMQDKILFHVDKLFF
jgi:thymidylate kinase